MNSRLVLLNLTCQFFLFSRLQDLYCQSILQTIEIVLISPTAKNIYFITWFCTRNMDICYKRDSLGKKMFKMHENQQLNFSIVLKSMNNQCECCAKEIDTMNTSSFSFFFRFNSSTVTSYSICFASRLFRAPCT